MRKRRLMASPQGEGGDAVERVKEPSAFLAVSALITLPHPSRWVKA